MNEVAMIWVLAGLLAFRALVLIRFWRIPLTLVKDRFFGLPMDPAVSGPLLQRYRRALLICVLIDVCCALAVAMWSTLYGLFLEQVIAAVLARISYSLISIHFIRHSKLCTAGGSWKPVRTVALMLTTRRLRAYVSLCFEACLPLVTIAAFALLIYLLWRDAEDWTHLRRSASFAALALYLQLGGLLLKHALVKWRWRMPGQRVDEFLRWREAVLRYWLWVCDYFRCVFTVALLAFVLVDVLHESGAQDRIIFLVRLVIAGVIIVAGIVGYDLQQRRLKPLWDSLRPLEDFSLPPETIDDREFFWGGVCYFNAENPALFVPGPLVYAINLANKRTYLYAAYLAVLVSLGVWCGVAQPRAQGAFDDSRITQGPKRSQTAMSQNLLSPEKLHDVAEGVRKLVDDDEAVGAEVLILHHRKVVLHEAFGWADLDRRIIVKPNTIACIRSMTKPLVGTSIQMLVDEGKLALTDRASKFLPSFDNDKSRAITVEQLLTHSAGFPLTRINKQLAAYSSQRDVADQAGQLGPDGSPGKFRYSDSDSETLAAIVSVLAGEPAEKFIQRRILQPLGMKDTYCVLESGAPERSRVSSNHAGSPGMWHKYWDHEERPFFPFFLGAASAYSTALDYAKLLELWLDRGTVGGKRLLSQAAIERALRPAYRMLSPGTDMPYPTGLKPLHPYYGQHWIVYVPTKHDTALDTLPPFGHSGSDGTLALVFPKQDVMAFYFTQSRGGMSVFRFEELLAPLLGLEKPSTHSRLSVEQLRPYLGSYREMDSTKRAWVTLRGKRLCVEIPDSGALLPRWPDADGRWELGESQPGISLTFDRNEAAEITGMKLLLNKSVLVKYERAAVPKDLPDVETIMALRRAKQGGNAIEALKSLELKGKMQIGALEAESLFLASGNDRVLRRLRSPALNSTTLVELGRAKRQGADGTVEELHGPMLEEALRINPIARLRDWRESFTSVEVAGLEGKGDQEAWILRLGCQFTPPVTRYVSTKTGLLLREDSWVTSKGVGTFPLAVHFDDYREVIGVKIPFRLTSESRVTGKQVTQFAEAIGNVEISKDAFRLKEKRD